MEEIEKVYEDFKNEKLSAKEACKKLVEIIFIKKKEFGLSSLDEDSLSDFMIFQLTHLEKIFKIFNEDFGNFTNFVYGSVQISLIYWKRKRAKNLGENDYLLQVCNEYYDEKEYRYSMAEKFQQDIISSDYSLKDVENLKKSFDKIKNIFRNNELFKLSIKILAIKSCCFMNEELIEKVAILTETEKSKVSNWIEYAKNEMSAKIKRMEQLKSKRDKAYFYRNRYLMQKNRFTQESWVFIVNDKLKLQSKKWKESLNALSSEEFSLRPSNVTVAKILNIDERQVAYILRKINSNVDNFVLPWYSFKNEDLPCKQ